MPYLVSLDSPINDDDKHLAWNDRATNHDVIADPDALSPEQLTIVRDYIATAKHHLSSLPEDHQRIARLAFDEGHSAREIGSITMQTSRAVESVLFRIRKMLKEKLARNSFPRKTTKAQRLAEGKQLRDNITRAEEGVQIVIRYLPHTRSTPSVASTTVGSDKFIHKGKRAIDGVLEKLVSAGHRGKKFACKGVDGVFHSGIVGIKEDGARL